MTRYSSEWQINTINKIGDRKLLIKLAYRKLSCMSCAIRISDPQPGVSTTVFSAITIARGFLPGHVDSTNDFIRLYLGVIVSTAKILSVPSQECVSARRRLRNSGLRATRGPPAGPIPDYPTRKCNGTSKVCVHASLVPSRVWRGRAP